MTINLRREVATLAAIAMFGISHASAQDSRAYVGGAGMLSTQERAAPRDTFSEWISLCYGVRRIGAFGPSKAGHYPVVLLKPGPTFARASTI